MHIPSELQQLVFPGTPEKLETPPQQWDPIHTSGVRPLVPSRDGFSAALSRLSIELHTAQSGHHSSSPGQSVLIYPPASRLALLPSSYTWSPKVIEKSSPTFLSDIVSVASKHK